MMRAVMGFDPSLTSSGAVILGLEDASLQTHRTIDGSKLRGPERLHRIRLVMTELVKLWKVELVAIEGYAYGKFMKREALGELGGVLRLALYDLRVPYIVIAPSSMKKFVTGKGNADKDEVMTAVSEKYGHNFDTDDEADAFGLALMAALTLNSQATKTTAAQNDIIRELRRAQ